MAEANFSIFKRCLILFILVVIVIVGFQLRRYSYGQVPHPGETADEYSFGWLGISLLRDGYPTAWSGISAYPQHDFQRINVDHIYEFDPIHKDFPIDRPWFDHPPLFGLTVGGYAYLTGVRNFVDASVVVLRKPMLVLGTLAIIGVFFIGWELYSLWVGLLAALLYAVIPIIAISSRLALAENAYLLLFIVVIYLAVKHLKNNKLIYWNLACVLAGTAMLFKLSAVALPLSLFLISLSFKKKDLTHLLPVIASVIIPLILFAIYGAFYNWQLFLNVFFTNTARIYGAGPEIFFSAVSKSKIVSLTTFTDGWLLIGWISLFVTALRRKKKDYGSRILPIAVFSYLIIFLLFGSEPYGWYRFPFYPFLVLSSAKVLSDLFKKADLPISFALFLLPFGTALHRLIGYATFQKYVPQFRLMIIVVFLTYLITKIIGKKSAGLIRVLLILFMAVLVYMSIKEIYFYHIDHWYEVS